jgi:hypothetical protein
MENLLEEDTVEMDYGEIPLTEINYIQIKSSCNLFDIYEGVYKKDNKPVIITTIKFLDIISNIEEFHKRMVNNKINEDKFLDRSIASRKTVQLKKLGYYFNNAENYLSYIYYKEDFTIINLEELFLSIKCEDRKIVKLQLFHDIIKTMKIYHRFNKRYSIIHPMMFVLCDRGFSLMDLFLDDIIQTVDRFKNFQLCSFFGYFEMDKISEIDEFDKIEKNRTYENYYNTDIILCVLNLAFLFSPQNKNIFGDSNLYEKLVHDLQKDYLTKNASFNNFLLNVKDEKIKKFISKHLFLNIKDFSKIEDFLGDFEKMLIEEYDLFFCFDCDEKEENYDENLMKVDLNINELKFLNYSCFHILCRICKNSNSHKCKDIHESNFSFFHKHYSSEVKRLIDITDRLPPLDEELKLFSEFDEPLKKVFSEISNEHIKLDRLVRKEDEKLNSILQYTDQILNKRITDDIEQIDLLYNDLEKRVLKLKIQIEEINIGKENPDKKLEQINNILKEENLEDYVLTLDNTIKNFESFLNKTQEMKNRTNFDIRVHNVLDKMQQKTNNLFNQVSEISLNQRDFLKSLDISAEIITKILKEYEVNSENSVLNELSSLNANYQLIATLNAEKNKVYIIYDPKKYETIRLNFQTSQEQLLSNCRYINLKTKMIITGGSTKISDQDVPSNLCYYIDFFEKSHNERKVNSLKPMNFQRDKHSMVRLNDFGLMAIGGMQTNTCEEYNLIGDTWKIKPSLNKIRYNTSVFVHNEIDLYVFFGLLGNHDRNTKNLIYNEDIERLNLSNSDANWEVINVNFEESIERREISLAGVLKSKDPNEIFILGGKNNNENSFSNLFYKYEFSKMTLSQLSSRKLTTNITFPNPNFVKWQFIDNENNLRVQWASYTPELVLYAIDANN